MITSHPCLDLHHTFCGYHNPDSLMTRSCSIFPLSFERFPAASVFVNSASPSPCTFLLPHGVFSNPGSVPSQQL